MYRIRGSLALAIMCFLHIVPKGLTQMDLLAEGKTHKRCTYERAYDMYGASCIGMKLDYIPNLKTSIEILDFTDNKLRDLKPTTFASYTSIKFLYLVENKIFKIDKDAFSPLTYLQVLDLSSNVLTDIPETIFQLPSLRQLYLRENPLYISDLALQKPIKAPIELLDVSNCDIQQLPNWGILPHLTYYNISYNGLVKLEAEHFAPMCKLEKVQMTKSIDKVQPCDLKPAITWLQSKHVYFQLDDYANLNTKEFEDCPSADFEALNITNRRCKAVYLEFLTDIRIYSAGTKSWGDVKFELTICVGNRIHLAMMLRISDPGRRGSPKNCWLDVTAQSQFQSLKSSRRTWLTVTGGLAGFLVGFMLLLYLMHRHNVAQTKTKAEKMKKAIPKNDRDTNASVPILASNETNDVSRL